MLHPDDEHTVQREHSIPGMRVLFDNDVATKMLQTSFLRLGVHAAICKYLRYKPDTSCVASFILHTRIGEIWAHAIAYRADAIEKLAKAQQAVSRSPDLRAVLVDQSLVVSLFPLDDDLHSLRLLASRSEQKMFLKKLAPHDEDLHSALITTLRYKPRRRFVGRIDVDGKPQAILKVHSLPEYLQARRAAKSLHSVSEITAATVIGHSDRHRAILLKWVPGESLAERIKDGTSRLQGIMKDLGRLLKEVHSHPEIKLSPHSVHENSCSLTAIPHELTAICPGLGHRAQVVCDEAAFMIEKLDLPVTSLHGDLSFDQIIAGDRVSLIDFDNAVLGHVEQDLGNLLAHFAKNSLYGLLPEELANNTFDLLIQEYERHGGEFKRHAIHTYAAAALLGMVQEPFRSRMANWHTCSEKIIDQARKHLDLAVSLSHLGCARNGEMQPTSLSSVSKFRSDSSLSKSYPAIDLRQVRNRLLPLMREELQDASLLIHALRLVRHKFGKRCLVEYTCESRELDCQFRVLGKAHAKQKHNRSHQVQRDLWQTGFGSHAADHIVVPKALGVVNEWQMWFQAYVTGEDVWTALSGDQKRVVPLILSAVEKLQRSQIAVDRQHTTTNEVEYLEKVLPSVALKFPEFRRRIAWLIFRCQALARVIPNTTLVPTHRDFYPDQILLTARGLCVLDLDLFCLSHPCLDLGNFCGHLIERGLREPEFARSSLECQSLFEAHYINSDRQHHWNAVEAFITLTLARHVYLATLFPDRARFMPAILEECELRLDAQLGVNTKQSDGVLTFTGV